MNIETKNWANELKNLLFLTLFGILVGIPVGAIDTLFGRTLLLIGSVRDSNPLYFLPFLALAGAFIVYVYQRWGGESSKGMGLIFAAGHGETERIPLRLIPFVMVGTWLTHLFGGSAGREGVAVQIGGTLSHWLSGILPVKLDRKLCLVVGMAAGFGGLFRTPLAATAFALEVLVAGRFLRKALVPSLSAALTAAAVSELLGLEKFTFTITAPEALELFLCLKLAGLGILFGLTGFAFAWCLKTAKSELARRISQPIKRVVVVGICLTILLLLLHTGRYCGLGTNLISASLNGDTIYAYDWLLKLLLTVVTLAAGYQGGEVTPLFSIGASLGVVLAGLFGVPVPLAAGLGYAAVFGSATNTVLAPILIGGEVFGWETLPCFFLVCAVASSVNRGLSIYGGQRNLED